MIALIGIYFAVGLVFTLWANKRTELLDREDVLWVVLCLWPIVLSNYIAIKSEKK